jgi:hypothetical protein
MTRVAPILGAVATAAALPGSAAEQAAAAHAVIVDPANVRMSWLLAMPSVRGGSAGAAFAGRAPSMGMARMSPESSSSGRPQTDEVGALLTAPAAFEVVADAAGDALIVKTGAGGALRLTTDGAIVAGALPGDTAASIDVTPGDPDRAGASMIVTVQYN